jgi:glucokinase
MSTPPLTLLAADIGGTSSRFAVFSEHGEQLRLEESVRIPTCQAQSFADLLDLLKQSSLGHLLPGCRAATMAVAGAVQRGNFAKPPNIPWEIDLRQTDLSALPRQITLINDFAAQAYACRTEAVNNALVINRGVAEPEAAAQAAMVAVIGAGTGLGHALLLPVGNTFLALPSEAGHTAFPFVGEAEQDYERFLLAHTGLEYIHSEVVVSGLGLALLHQYHFGEVLDPAQAAAALTPDSPVQTWFAKFYGRACRQFVLSTLAMGGLFVSGGVAAKNPCLIQDAAFLAEFMNNLGYGHLLRTIPVALNSNEDSGLWGAALYASLSLERERAL